jgi:hypothetical protein
LTALEDGMQTFLIAVAALRLLSPVEVAQAGSAPPTQVQTMRSADIDANGQLAIVSSNGQVIIIRKEGEQTSFSAPITSSARTAVAAQALFPNCCTSYDIPMQLVVFARGTVHRFKGEGWPIFQWGFADGGTRIAYGQEPVHFGCATHYQLRDIDSERLIDSIDVPQPCGQIPEPKTVKIPQWVSDLISKRQ